jgi:hypothetical protein
MIEACGIIERPYGILSAIEHCHLASQLPFEYLALSAAVTAALEFQENALFWTSCNCRSLCGAAELKLEVRRLARKGRGSVQVCLLVCGPLINLMSSN